MTQYNALKVKLFNSQFNELKLGIKNGTEATFILSKSYQMLLVILMKIIFLINCY